MDRVPLKKDAVGLVFGRTVGLFCAVALLAETAHAEVVAVPIAVQIDLLAKVAASDRGFERRAASFALTLVVVNPKSKDSMQTGDQALAALARLKDMGGRPHQERLVEYTQADKLRKLCEELKPSVVFLSQDFPPEDVTEIVKALDGLDVLTATAVARFVRQGVVLGFDLVEGKPKIYFSAVQAGRQHISMSDRVLSLMTVFR